jgi:hypothetical protein
LGDLKKTRRLIPERDLEEVQKQKEVVSDCENGTRNLNLSKLPLTSESATRKKKPEDR